MAIKDILLTMTSYPDPTPVSVTEEAVSVAAALGAHLAAISCEVHVEIPQETGFQAFLRRAGEKPGPPRH